jgi:hypothetical protein
VAVVVLAVSLIVPTIRARQPDHDDGARSPRGAGGRYGLAGPGQTVQRSAGALGAADEHTRDLEVAYEADLDPWLGWYLRDLDNAHAVAAVGPNPSAAVLITAGCGGTPPPGYIAAATG